MYYLYLDDVREMPPLYDAQVKSYNEFAKYVKRQGPDISLHHISFDHDLGKGKNGYDCAKFLVEWCLDNGYSIPSYDIHSANPVGAENIKSIFETVKKISVND